MSSRALIVLHADDLGMNVSVNAGIMSGFSHGLLTSASILSNGPGFYDAVSRWTRLDQERVAGRLCSIGSRRALGDSFDWPFDLGVHLNLTQGSPLTPGFPRECLDSAGRFVGIGRMLRTLTLHTRRLRSAIIEELTAQVARVVDAGLRPTHLNGHHYLELIPALAEPIRALALRFQIPAMRVARERHVWLALRHHPSPAPNVCLALIKAGLARRLRQRVREHVAHTDAFCGTAHAGRMSLELLARSIADLRPGSTLEVGLHPGQAPHAPCPSAMAQGWRDPLADLRPLELAMVQSPQLVCLLADAKLRLGRMAGLSRPMGMTS